MSLTYIVKDSKRYVKLEARDDYTEYIDLEQVSSLECNVQSEEIAVVTVSSYDGGRLMISTDKEHASLLHDALKTYWYATSGAV